MANSTWLEKVGLHLAHVCNGDITTPRPHPNVIECKMSNGKVTASVASDGTKRLSVIKKRGEKMVQRASMESLSDEMVVTRSLSGSIEFLHRMGNSPEMRIEQKGKKLGQIRVNAFNDKVKTTLYGFF